MTTHPRVVEGKIYFTQKFNSVPLENFEIPISIDTVEDFEEYLNDLLNGSGCDIASIYDISVPDWDNL